MFYCVVLFWWDSKFTVIQGVHWLLYIVWNCHFFSVCGVLICEIPYIIHNYYPYTTYKTGTPLTAMWSSPGDWRCCFWGQHSAKLNPLRFRVKWWGCFNKLCWDIVVCCNGGDQEAGPKMQTRRFVEKKNTLFQKIFHWKKKRKKKRCLQREKIKLNQNGRQKKTDILDKKHMLKTKLKTSTTMRKIQQGQRETRTRTAFRLQPNLIEVRFLLKHVTDRSDRLL